MSRAQAAEYFGEMFDDAQADLSAATAAPSAHILPLSAVHATAHGAVLALLRRATIPLSCEGTDYWRALWADDCLIIWPRSGRAHNSMPWVYGLDDPQDRDHSDLMDWLLRFGLRMDDPQVASRVAGLCAMALDSEAVGPAWVNAVGEIGPEFWVIRYADKAGYAAQIGWEMASGRVHRRGLTSPPPNVPAISAGLPDAASFLAALFLTLAPRITALGGSCD